MVNDASRVVERVLEGWAASSLRDGVQPQPKHPLLRMHGQSPASRSRAGKWVRVRRGYSVMRTCIPSARVIRMSVAKVGLPSGASAL